MSTVLQENWLWIHSLQDSKILSGSTPFSGPILAKHFKTVMACCCFVQRAGKMTAANQSHNSCLNVPGIDFIHFHQQVGIPICNFSTADGRNLVLKSELAHPCWQWHRTRGWDQNCSTLCCDGAAGVSFGGCSNLEWKSEFKWHARQWQLPVGEQEATIDNNLSRLVLSWLPRWDPPER